jgi:hypothetical protein
MSRYHPAASGTAGSLTACLAAALFGLLAAPLPAETVLPSIYWRNTLSFPSDPFRSQGHAIDDFGWIKFTIFVGDQTRVYFQDSVHFPFHYDFGVACVREYAGMSYAEFDAITLHADGQQAILGTVIMPHWTSSTPPAQVVGEYGIQFVRQDPYDPAQVVSLFNLVKSKISANPGVEAFYFPTYEQLASAELNRAYLEANGVTLSSPARWATGNVGYSAGWALGTLKYFPVSQINAAYLDGRLLPGDILLTDAVPAELPVMAGIISLSPSTPNSHVAILSSTYGIPFVWLAITNDAARAQSLVSHDIVLRAYSGYSGWDIRLIDVEGQLAPEQQTEILAMKAPVPLNISPVAPYGAYSANTDILQLSDIRYFGGKAANFGLIRRAIPASSPVALGISFDLWTAFMNQALPGGGTLRDSIRARLAGYTYPPNMAALAADLDAIREQIKSTTATAFTPEQQSEVIAILQHPQYGFDPNRNIRFRSSTNVEDSAQFTGAGLYDSFSGCLADELDGDDLGPSICDPTESKERGVFRAIRKVFASFYNDNAYLSRLLHGVDEDQVGMALLVHHSTPDEFELANGVATLERKGPTSKHADLVTQVGAVSVTNPTDGSLPEVVEATISGSNTYLTLVDYSNLLPLGETVLTWDSEYRMLAGLLVSVSGAFETATGKTRYLLDFEYKKISPGNRLSVKQVREVPQPGTTPTIVPFLLNEPVQYCVHQGEGGNVFANHRLKSQWSFQTANVRLTAANLETTFYADTSMEYAADGHIRTLTGPLDSWPQAAHSFAGNTTTDSWRINTLENPRTYQLTTHNVGVLVSPAQNPLLTLRDLGHGYLDLRADYAKPVPVAEGTTSTDQARLWPCPQPQAGDVLQERIVSGPKGQRIQTRFYWPPRPNIIIIYTAPLSRFVETTITGYTSQPIVLHGHYAQTYLPHHHNFGEEFLFEPGLEPGLSPALMAELKAKNIRMFHVYYDQQSQASITTYGFVPPGDFDHDGRVDLRDLDHFEGCRSGPTLPWTSDCGDADLDADADVDQEDFGIFQKCFAGPEKPADPACAD